VFWARTAIGNANTNAGRIHEQKLHLGRPRWMNFDWSDISLWDIALPKSIKLNFMIPWVITDLAANAAVGDDRPRRNNRPNRCQRLVVD
jgi:hypothetical protein